MFVKSDAIEEVENLLGCITQTVLSRTVLIETWP